MMFMKSERYFKNNLIKKLGKITLFSTFSLISLTFLTGFYYEPNINIKLNDITVELGEELPPEVNDYKNIIVGDKYSGLEIETNAPLDKDGNTTLIGKYTYYLVYKDDSVRNSKQTNAKAKLTVVDTIKPIIKLKDKFTTDYGVDFSPNEVAEIKEKIDLTASGDHEVTVVATDKAGNTSEAKTVIAIREKPAPVVYGFYPFYNSTIDDMNNDNNQRNSTLTEEEKMALRQELAAFSMNFIGNPYVYGGTSLTNGADCSGFTMSIYANYGYKLPRGSIEQAYVGKQVYEGELLPGDIVAYYGHVGIYIGNGMMVHASTPEGGIKYAPVYNDYHIYRRIIY